jgi:uronate dehydrogenase
MHRERVLVTGARGRVAGQLLPAVRDRWDLRLLDHAGDGDDLGAPLLVGELTDRRLLATALDGVDAVVHLAGNPDPEAPWSQLRDPNVEGFAALLDVARDRGVRRVVFASSVHAMGAHEGRRRWPIDPAWPPAPCCAYGATKAFDEGLARAYDYRTDMTLIGLRLGLCAPEATPAQAAAGWLRPEDLRRIVTGALEADVPSGVYPAVSWAARRRWNIDSTMADLGYDPVRDADPPDAGEELITCKRSGDSA